MPRACAELVILFVEAQMEHVALDRDHRARDVADLGQREHARVADGEVHQPVGLERDPRHRDVADPEVDGEAAERDLDLGVDLIALGLALVAGLLGEQRRQRRIEHAACHRAPPWLGRFIRASPPSPLAPW
jgi:hypothetical protein